MVANDIMQLYREQIHTVVMVQMKHYIPRMHFQCVIRKLNISAPKNLLWCTPLHSHSEVE